MNKTIKIIDLLNKIANGEDVPKEIKYDGLIYTWDINKYLHYRDEIARECSLLEGLVVELKLNDTVKILEDNTEEIEELKYRDTNYFNMLSEEAKVRWLFKYIQEDEDKINELVRAVNKN